MTYKPNKYARKTYKLKKKFYRVNGLMGIYKVLWPDDDPPSDMYLATKKLIGRGHLSFAVYSHRGESPGGWGEADGADRTELGEIY